MNQETHTHDHGRAPSDLTRNQSLVFGALSRAEGPLSAYTILDQLRDDGFRAPLQVYRALDKLVETGMVHRLESLNAFVACSHRAATATRPLRLRSAKPAARSRRFPIRLWRPGCGTWPARTALPSNVRWSNCADSAPAAPDGDC